MSGTKTSMRRSLTQGVATIRIDSTDVRSIAPWRCLPLDPMKERSMKFTIQLLIEDTDRLPLLIPLDTIDRPCDVVEDVGLRLQESKAVLGGSGASTGESGRLCSLTKGH